MMSGARRRGCKSARVTVPHASAQRCTTPALRKLTSGRLSSSDQSWGKSRCRVLTRRLRPLRAIDGRNFCTPTSAARRRPCRSIPASRFRTRHTLDIRTACLSVGSASQRRNSTRWDTKPTFSEVYRASRTVGLRPSRRGCNDHSSTESPRVCRSGCVQHGRTPPSCNVRIRCDRASGSAGILWLAAIRALMS